MKRTLLGLSMLCVGTATIFPACSSKTKGVSDKTGWNYNDPRLGGFDVANYPGQQTGPGLVPVEGGRFTMGQTEEDITYERNNIPRDVTVSSFYMDETEVANVHYREYIYWLQRSYGPDYPEEISKALPDTTAWREALAFNEPLVTNYFRHAAYNNYPVVGVNWYQANAYCKWRSDRVNEMILIKNGMLKKNQNQVNEDVFNSEAYVSGQYLGTPGRNQKRDLDPNGAGKRNASYADGYMRVGKRLPTEAEWEFAARGGQAPARYYWGNTLQPNGNWMANIHQGHFPDYNSKEDGYVELAPVRSFPPNAYGLYDMEGNVWEWCSDLYRPDYYRYSPANDPHGPADSYDPDEPGAVKHVQRGGSFLCSDQYCIRYKAGSRGKGETRSASNNLGFRCVRDIK